MEGCQLSHDEYKKCVNACVKVAIFDRLSEQLPDDVQHSDEGFNGGSKENLRNLDADFYRSIVKIAKIKLWLLELEQELFNCEQLPDDVQPSDEGFNGGRKEHLRNLDADFFYRLIVKIVEVTRKFRLIELEQELFRLRPQLLKEQEKEEEEEVEESYDDEIDHGSGFIIADKLVITNMHVVEDALHDETKEIRISNAAIGELLCEVVRYDVANDLALLYCRDLDLKQNGICPLQLSEEALWPSVPIFTFGYPITHTGETALYVRGYVSGSVDRYGREPLIALYCPVYHGNSGGPVICRIKDELKAVAVIAQRHKKEIVTIEERNTIEEMRHSLQPNLTTDLTHNDEWNFGLTLKLFDALETTHCPFNFCNAVPGHLVIGFMNDN